MLGALLRFRLICGLLLACLGWSSAWAEVPRATVSPGLSHLELSPYVDYHVDLDGAADAASMFDLAENGQFRPLPHGAATFGFRNGVHWLHARLYNDGNGEQRWLLLLEYSLLDNIDVYMRYPDGRIDHLASGDKLPFSARAIRYRQPNFWLDLPQSAEVELLVRVQTESSMQVPLAIYTFSAFAEMERDAQIGIGLYNGILLALFLYNFVLWLSLRDTSHFWYLGHLAGFGLVLFCLNGLAFEYLWPQSPWLANHAIPLAMCLSQLAMHQFTRVFLDLRTNWPIGDRLSRAFMCFYAAVGFYSLWSGYRLPVLLGTYSVFPGVMLVLVQSFRSIRHGYRPARMFLAAWTMMLLGAAMYASVSLGLLGKNFLTEFGIQIGSAVEMILLSYALAYRHSDQRGVTELQVREANEKLERSVSQRTSELSSALEQLAEANSRLRESSRRDVLTGLFNRRHFREMFEQMLVHAQETRQAVSLLLIDLDHFKKVNDSYGHLAGDECLRALARHLTKSLGAENALVARFGGEEFVVLLPGATETRALDVAERIRRDIGMAPVQFSSGKTTMTASIGVYSVPVGTSTTPDEVLHFADEALYSAKHAGRNRVCVAPVTS